MRHATTIALCLASMMVLVEGCSHAGQKAATRGRGPGDAAQARAGERPWRDSFSVDPGVLAPTGANPYLPLRPGNTWTYRDGSTTLTVKVLDEVESIDGVMARVVEEREESGGTPKEVSRNFLAIDMASRDLYYFGEDVDIYSQGQVATHDGAWRSGAGGARFGLFLPGTPKVGDRYYQEVAPGVAMDRVEVVSIEERVDTPAGTFEHCVHLRETTPLERGTGDKWFAPGVGLVKDGGMVLVSHNQPASGAK